MINCHVCGLSMCHHAGPFVAPADRPHPPGTVVAVTAEEAARMPHKAPAAPEPTPAMAEPPEGQEGPATPRSPGAPESRGWLESCADFASSLTESDLTTIYYSGDQEKRLIVLSFLASLRKHREEEGKPVFSTLFIERLCKAGSAQLAGIRLFMSRRRARNAAASNP